MKKIWLIDWNQNSQVKKVQKIIFLSQKIKILEEAKLM